MPLNITPPPVLFELHAYGKTYDVSNSLLEWNKNEVVLSRKDTSGVYREFTFPFKFVMEAYETVEEIFRVYGFRAKADVYISLLNDDWTYGEPYIFNLDFSTYDQSDTVIEINSRRSDLYEYLKEKESVNYDIPVAGVKDSLPWKNERIIIENTLTETIYEEAKMEQYASLGNILAFFRMLGVSTLNSEIYVTGFLAEKTIGNSRDVTEGAFFLEATRDVVLDVDFELSGNLSIIYSDVMSAPIDVYVWINKDINDNSNQVYHGRVDNPLTTTLDFGRYKTTRQISLSKGEKLYLKMGIYLDSNHANFMYNSNISGKIKFSYKAKHPEIDIDVMRPEVLLQKLVDKITETEGYSGNPAYPATIEAFNANSQDLTMLLASESIRGFTDAKVYTSHKDFKAWMMTQGYEMFVEGNQLIYRKREKSFNKNLQAIELFEEDCAGLKTYVEKNYLFSGLKIGYKKKDYENTNGRFEFNGQHDYSTDYTGNAKAFELISPYRADCYGIEFLAQTAGKDTTDDKSDKDLFIVNVRKDSKNYGTVYKTMTSAGTEIPQTILDTLFNAKFNPFELLKLNAGLLGASVNTLKFTASDANKDIIINGGRIDGNYTIPENMKLFDSINYDFASRNIKDLPGGNNINGLVRIHYRGNIYEGFIKEISKNPAWETETQWVLWKKHQ